MKTQTKRIVYQVITPKAQGTGLSDTIKLLKALTIGLRETQQQIDQITATSFTAARKGIEDTIKQAQKRPQQFGLKGAPGLTPNELAKVFGLDPGNVTRAFAAFRAQMRAEKRKVGDVLTAEGEFRTVPKAADFISTILAPRRSAARGALDAIMNGPARASGTVSPGDLAKIAAAMEKIAAGAAGGPARDAGTGQFQSGEAGPAPRRRKGKGLVSAPPVPGREAELERTITETTRGATTRITEMLAPFKTQATTRDEENEITKRVVTEKKGAALREELNERLKDELAWYKNQKGGRSADDLSRMSAAALKTAANLDAFRQERGGEMKAMGMGSIDKSIGRRVEALTREAELLEIAAAKARQAAARTEMEAAEETRAATVRRHNQSMKGAKARTAQEEKGRQEYAAFWQQILANREATAQAEAEEEEEQRRSAVDRHNRSMKGARQRQAEEEKKRAGYEKMWAGLLDQQDKNTPPVIPPPVIPKTFGQTMKDKFGEMRERHFTPQAIVGNMMNVGGWMLAVKTLQTLQEAAQFAGKELAETQMQAARLGQTFRGVGGSAADLTGDVLGLAAAEQRSRDEAMESSIAWTRLGLTRAQANETVRVSLQATNVAEMGAIEATEHLEGVMGAYGLQVYELSALLGSLNSISNNYNATNKQMLTGLSKVASLAKQAGLPLEQLEGLLAGGIGKTGQTGAAIGTAIKSIIGNISNPEIQKFLRNQFKIEVTTDGGNDIKNFGQVLGQIYAAYQKLNRAEQAYFLNQVAGRTQASRMQALLDSYVKGQVLAINAQLELNSAEMESARIKSTLISRWMGLKAVMSKGLFNGEQQLGVVRGLSDAMGLVNNLGYRAQRLFPALPNQPQREGPLAWAVRKTEAPADEAQRRASGFDPEVQKALGAVKAAQNSAELLRTVQKSILSMSPADQMKRIEELGGMHTLSDPAKFRAGLTTAVKSGGQSAVNQVIGEEATGMEDKLRAARAVYEQASRRQRRELIRGILTEPDEGKKKELQSALDSLVGKGQVALQAFDDMAADFQSFQESTLRTITNLERQKQVLDGIAEVYRDMPAATESERLAREVAGLQMQERFLKERREYLNRDDTGMSHRERREEGLKVDEELRRVQSTLGARNDPSVRGLADFRDRRRIAMDLAKSEADVFEYSETGSRSDALNRRMAGLRKLIEVKEDLARSAATEMERQNAAAQVDEHRADLARTRLDFEKERAQLLKEEYEFGRKLLTASPGDLLRKLAAAKYLERNPNPMQNVGRFMAMSPELREAILEQQRLAQNREFMRTAPTVGQVQNDILGKPADRYPKLLEDVMRSVSAQALRQPAGSFTGDINTGGANAALATLNQSAAGAAAALSGLREGMSGILKTFREDVALTAQALQDLRAGAPYLPQAHG